MMNQEERIKKIKKCDRDKIKDLFVLWEIVPGSEELSHRSFKEVSKLMMH